MEQDALAGRSILDEAVPTPLVYIDRAVLERNIRTMAEAARRSGVGLRPHTKTHKIAAIAKRQLSAGALGLTVAKLAEARALVEADVSTSFMVAQPYVGREKIRWQLDLAEMCEVIASVDNLDVGRVMGEEAAKRGRAIDVVLIVDTGYGRFGVQPDEAPALADQLAAVKGVRFRGIRSHSGTAYGATTAAARQAITLDDARVMSETARRIRERDLLCEIVSVGSTPGIVGVASETSSQGVTEWRPGNYVFFDRMQISLGTATVEDCALRIVVSVVSTPTVGRAMIDAGRKTLAATVDPQSAGYGVAIGRPGVEIYGLSEECGWVRHEDEELHIGDRLELIPNHACELTNLVEVVAYGTDGIIEGFWEPAARGKIW